MNRRNFLKITAITGIAALVPLEFIVDNRDNETKFLEYIIIKYDDEIAVLTLLKHYGWVHSGGNISGFFKGLAERQPNVVSWLRDRIKIKRVNGVRHCSNPRYDKLYKSEPESEKWREWVRKVYPDLAHRFNLCPKKELA